MKKNIFIIPSWYPTENNKLSGIFFKEQAHAIANAQNDYNIIVSTWGFTEGIVHLRSFSSIFNKLKWYIFSKKNIIMKDNNLYVVFNPHLSFSNRIPFLGSIKRLININKKNLITAELLLGKIDIIHAHVSYPGGYMAYELSKSFNIPYIITEHMGPFPFKEFVKNNRPIREIDLAIQNASQVIAVSPSLSNRMISYGYREPITIPNMVNEDCFKIILNLRKSNKFIFLSICSMSGNEKGIDDLLTAIELWNPDEKIFHFIIAGDGGYLSFYKDMAVKKNINKLITWRGYIDREEAPLLFNSCNVFVLPSKHETFGLVYAEAIACGLPIIATKCGGPEYIVDEFNGLLVNINNPLELRDAMLSLYSNYKNYDKLLIRKNFLNKFSKNIVSKSITKIYNEITN